MKQEMLIAEAIGLLQTARFAVALTGAGISVPSGIPDFRSQDSGLWNQVDAMEVASIYGFLRRPQAFYDWMRPLAPTLLGAKPNPAHIALAQLEQHGPLQSVITQNIDMLHTKAGSKAVYEVHGHMREATCQRCYHIVAADSIMPAYLETGQVPLCPQCQGVLKPNVILFGELLPFDVLHQAQKDTDACDLMIVAGSSLEVTPICDLPAQAKARGARLIIVNFTETPYDYLADIVIHADVADVLPQLAAPFIPVETTA